MYRFAIGVLATFLAASAEASGEFEIIAKTCPITPVRGDIEVRCLNLIQSGKLSRIWVPTAYLHLSQQMADREQYDQAINYARKGIAVELENFQADPKYRDEIVPHLGKVRLAAMSYKYYMLGLLLGVVRAGEGETDKGFEYAKQERAAYSSAVTYNPAGHKAYMGLAEVQSLLCSDAEAESSRRTAIRLVEAQDPDLAHKYKREFFSGCRSSWKGRS